MLDILLNHQITLVDMRSMDIATKRQGHIMIFGRWEKEKEKENQF